MFSFLRACGVFTLHTLPGCSPSPELCPRHQCSCFSMFCALGPPLHFYERRFYWASSSRRAWFHCSWRLAWMNVFFLISFFISARNVVAASSSADVASPVIFIFSSPSLFLNLCNHPLLAVNSLVSRLQGSPCWRLRIDATLPGTTVAINRNIFPVPIFYPQIQCILLLS